MSGFYEDIMEMPCPKCGAKSNEPCRSVRTGEVLKLLKCYRPTDVFYRWHNERLWLEQQVSKGASTTTQ